MKITEMLFDDPEMVELWNIAVLKEDEQNLVDLVIELDSSLTGKTPREAAQTARSQMRMLSDPVEFALGGEYYLSDGGYSRIVFNEGDGRLFLTSNSRDQVKARWELPEVRAVVGRIEELINLAISNLGGQDAGQ